MQTADQVREYFLKAAEVKIKLAATAGLAALGTEIVAGLARTRAFSGIIRIFSDPQSRWSAHHFNEECVVRFKAGKAYGREDRAAINSRQYCEYSPASVIDLIESGRFDSGRDSLVVFASKAECRDLEPVLACAKSKNLSMIISAPESLSALRSFSDSVFAIPSESSAIITCLHSVFLHFLCESFEAEYDAELHSLPQTCRRSAEVDTAIASDPALVAALLRASHELTKRIDSGATIFLAGNGGSTCDASALAEHAKGLNDSRGRKFEVFDLHAPDTLLCAYNDNFPLFARQIEANGRVGDVFITYSTSGNSQNLIDAVVLAKAKGMVTLGLTGKGGGKLAGLCDFSIVVPSAETERIQEAHALIGRGLFGELKS